MQPIEGITPSALWTTVGVLLGFCAVIVLIYKVIEIVRKEKEIKDKNKMISVNGRDITDEIADKVLEKLEPRLSGIESKLKADKERLENHEYSLNELARANKETAQGLAVVCEGTTALLDHELHNGNEAQMHEARNALEHYKNKLILSIGNIDTD